MKDNVACNVAQMSKTGAQNTAFIDPGNVPMRIKPAIWITSALEKQESVAAKQTCALPVVYRYIQRNT